MAGEDQRQAGGGVGYGEGRLTVSDNDEDSGGEPRKGAGLKLIAALARQIGGSVEQEESQTGRSAPGSSFR